MTVHHATAVLVTRPAEQQARLCDALAQAGFDPVSLPLLEILPITASDARAQAIKNRVTQLDQYAHVIFISANAVSCGMRWLEDYWPQWPLGVHWYAIGRATAEQLAQHGVAAVAGADSMNSEELLAHAQLHNVEGARILIVRGVGGRETLAGALRARGAQVDYCEVYERRAVHDKADELRDFLQRAPRAICANSGETVQALLAQHIDDTTRCALLQTSLVVPGERVAQIAREHAFENVIVAHNAGVPATVAALSSLD